MGNLSSLRLFSGSIVVSPLLGWSPPHVSAGNLACLMWLGPLSSFSRPVSALVTCWVQSSKSCNRASPMHEHFASLCVHLICYHLIYQGSPIAESRVSMRRNHPVTWIQIDIEQLGDHYSNSIPRCHIKFFFQLFFWEKLYCHEQLGSCFSWLRYFLIPSKLCQPDKLGPLQSLGFFQQCCPASSIGWCGINELKDCS